MGQVATGDAGIDNYQARAANQSDTTATRLARWQAATTKGTITLPGGTSYTPNNDTLIIAAIIVGGGIWYYYRRKIGGVAKKVENAA